MGPRACTAHCLVTQISPVCPKFPGQVRLSILLCRWGKPHTAICSSVTAERAMQLLPGLNWERLLQAILHFPYRLSGWEGPGAIPSLSCELILLPVLLHLGPGTDIAMEGSVLSTHLSSKTPLGHPFWLDGTRRYSLQQLGL